MPGTVPENTLGWWKSQVPDPKSRKLHWAPNDVMLHYFTQIDQQPEKEDVRYILALLMIRRRILRLEETERDEQGREIMILYCPRDENEYSVTAKMPSKNELRRFKKSWRTYCSPRESSWTTPPRGGQVPTCLVQCPVCRKIGSVRGRPARIEPRLAGETPASRFVAPQY